jgi:hypothetical protein
MFAKIGNRVFVSKIFGMMQFSFTFLFCFILIYPFYCFPSEYESIVNSICYDGELENGYSTIKLKIQELEENEIDHNTSTSLSFSTIEYVKLYHTLSELELILFSHFEESLLFHRKGKDLSSSIPSLKVIPPLPEFQLSGISCGGVSDLFYVSAVIIKSMIDREITKTEPSEHEINSKYVKDDLESLMTLITLTSDSGLITAAEIHLSHAFQLLSRVKDSPPLLTEKERVDYLALLTFRSALLTPAVFSSKEELFSSRRILQQRISSLFSSAGKGELSIAALDEFVLSPTFYLIYYGFNDKSQLQQLHKSYQLAFPSLTSVNVLPSFSSWKRQVEEGQEKQQLQSQKQSLLPTQQASLGGLSASEPTVISPPEESPKEKNEGTVKIKRRIRIGFVSSYFRKHSICKLFCSMILHLSSLEDKYTVFLFSALQADHHDSYTKKLIQLSSSSASASISAHSACSSSSSSFHFISVGKPLVNNRNRILSYQCDVLVYLDIGMEPSMVVWASARLAPIQMVLWGHPSTTGLESIDYYITSQLYYQYSPASVAFTEGESSHVVTQFVDSIHDSSDNSFHSLSSYPQSFFSEQLIQLQNLNFHFWKPSLSLELKMKWKKHIIKKKNEQQRQSGGGLKEKSKQDNNNDDDDKTSIQLLLIKREKSYYQMVVRYLKEENKKKISKGSQQLIELLSMKLKGVSHSATMVGALNDRHLPNNEAADIGSKNEIQTKVFYLLCPQYLLKFHPNFDKILLSLILWNYPDFSDLFNSSSFSKNNESLKKREGQFKIRLILLNNSEKRLIWQKILIQRWRISLFSSASYSSVILSPSLNVSSFESIASTMIDESVIWMPSLSSEEYLLLLGIGDLMLDPFPFGGGVTTLESLFMCTPVLTLPNEQNVPQLASGMLTALTDHARVSRRMSDSDKSEFQRLTVVHNQQDYLNNIQELLFSTLDDENNYKLQFLRKSICENHNIFYNDVDDDDPTVREGTGREYHQESNYTKNSFQEWSEMFQNLFQNSL